jgi:hypothetical protein
MRSQGCSEAQKKRIRSTNQSLTQRQACFLDSHVNGQLVKLVSDNGEPSEVA